MVKKDAKLSSKSKVKSGIFKKVKKKLQAVQKKLKPKYLIKCHHTCCHKYLKFFQAGKQKDMIKMAVTNHLAAPWTILEKSVLEPRKGYFDQSSLTILNAFSIDEGVLLFYFVKKPCAIGAALFDQMNPEVLLWRTANPIYQSEKDVIPQKVTKSKREITLYLRIGGKIQRTQLSLDYLLGRLKRRRRVDWNPLQSMVQRSQENPIIRPMLTHIWENCATFNTAAIYLAGKVHFLYRAIGASGMSVLGYAASRNGIHIDERLDDPVYVPREPFEFRHADGSILQPTFPYASGGGWGDGWGGCEDPRLTKIGKTIYMTYTAFNGAEPPGVALTSISEQNFLQHKWRWRKPVLISPRGQINKNWVIFPEKINGRYAILHSISPQVCIDYFNRLDADEDICIQSYHGPSLRYRCWDNQLRGVGPPPIKTEEGWLVLYHAMDDRDPNRYKLGAMMLDYQDPTQVRYRAIQPILGPDAMYENQGYKSGVIYSCGAVVMGDRLFVYYGGADTVTCVATANLPQFLQRLKHERHSC